MAEYKMEFENGPILVDLTPTEKAIGLGYHEANRDKKQQEDEENSDAALHNALQTVYRAAARVSEMMGALEQAEGQRAPEKVEIEFGLALRQDTRANIVKFGGEMHFRVKLTWGGE